MMAKPAHGFTLLETLVVVLIIGIASAAIVFRSMPSNSLKSLNNYANYLKAQLQLAREKSLVSGASIGLKIEEHSYQFCQYFSANKQWAPVADRFWKETKIPSWINFTFKVTAGEKSVTGEGCVPQVVFFASGDATPFQITLQGKGIEKQIAIIGGASGTIEVQGG